MKRHAFVTVALLGACGGKQTRSAPDEPPVDAAPAVVVPPAVAELRAKIAATKDDGELLLLHSELAQVLWASSCKAPIDGLCLTYAPRTAQAPACDGRTEDFVVTPRAVAVVNEVEEVIGELRQLWGDGSVLAEGADERNRALAATYAEAMLIPADQEIEALLAEPMLTGLVYDGYALDDASALKLQDWEESLWRGRDRVFGPIAQVGGDTILYQWAPEVVVESIARFALMDALLGARVAGLDLPTGAVGDAEGTEWFCNNPLDLAATYFTEWAEAGWSQCVQDAESFGVTGPVVDRCKAELEKVRPQ